MAATLTPPLDATDHVRGDRAAPLSLVMFGDFECPFCRAAQAVVARVLDRVGDDLVFAFRHLPIPARHPVAELAAEAAEAAGAQGAFWAFHDAAYEAQARLSERELVAIAGALGLDAARLEAEARSGRHRPRVERDVASAVASGVDGTPAFFVNGVRHEGVYDAGSLTAALRGG